MLAALKQPRRLSNSRLLLASIKTIDRIEARKRPWLRRTMVKSVRIYGKYLRMLLNKSRVNRAVGARIAALSMSKAIDCHEACLTTIPTLLAACGLAAE